MVSKQNVTLEVTKGDFTFVFHMPFGCTWGNAIDASFEILQHVNQLAQKSVEAVKPPVEGEVTDGTRQS